MGYSPWGRKESNTTEQLAQKLLTLEQMQISVPRGEILEVGEFSSSPRKSNSVWDHWREVKSWSLGRMRCCDNNDHNANRNNDDEGDNDDSQSTVPATRLNTLYTLFQLVL